MPEFNALSSLASEYSSFYGPSVHQDLASEYSRYTREANALRSLESEYAGYLEPMKDSKANSFGRRAQRFEHKIFEGSGKSIGGMNPGAMKTGLGYGQKGASMLRGRYLKMSGYESITQALGSNLNAKTMLGYTSGAGISKNLLGAMGGVVPSGLLGAGIMYGMGMEDTVAGALKEGFLMDASFRLSAPAGAGMLRSMAGGFGWMAVGGSLGLGTGGTLALQGATYMVGGRALTAAVGSMALKANVAIGAAYYGGKAAYEGLKSLHETGSNVRRTNFSSGDMSYATANAGTMRQQALGAIQKSHMNARSMLGNEGLTYARAIGE